MRQALLKWTDEKFDVSPLLRTPAKPFHVTAHGALFHSDCMKLLPLIKDGTVDTVFADPPFNLGKEYGENTDDSLPDDRYIVWCGEWLGECVRVLKPGGSLNGVTLKDVWTDIPPVRHWKFKSKDRRANALSTKILDRVVEMSTEPSSHFRTTRPSNQR